MASPSSPAPGPRWAVLCRKACIDPALPPGVGCRARGWRAPGLTELFVSPLVDGGSGALVRDPIVLAAHPSGLLLLSGSPDGERTAYFLCNAASNTVRQLPDAPGCTGAAGLIVAPGRDSYNDFMVAELVLRASDDDATLLRYFSPSLDGGLWSHKTLSFSPSLDGGLWLSRFTWCTDCVLSHLGMLWWVDLSQGLLACDLFTEELYLHFVPFPNVRLGLRSSGQRPRRDPSSQRCVGLSDGKLRYVVLTTRAIVPKIKLWTLADPGASKWTLDYELSCKNIWDDLNYNRTGLLNRVPTLALVDPFDPQVVFLFERWHLYGFDMRAKKLTDCANLGIDKKEASPTFALAWQLSPFLNIPAGRSPRDNLLSSASVGRSPRDDLLSSASDALAAAFGNACDRAITDMEFHQFTKFALADLNKRIRKEENRFRVSKPISICYFDDKFGTEEFEYAHINFDATNDSKMNLVFAEVSRKKGNGSSPWTLSSCKTLTEKNSCGGLYGVSVDESVDVEGARKRKRSLYCFACRDKLKHPKGGFRGGRDISTTY